MPSPRLSRGRTMAYILTVLFLITSLFYYAHAARGVGSLVPDKSKSLLRIESALDPGTSRTCVDSGKDHYCADSLKTLAWSLKEAGKEEATITITGYITSYSFADSCHNVVNGKCLMANGQPVYPGAVACPYFLELGRKVKIDGMIHTCTDRYARYLDSKRGLPTFDIFVEKDPKGLYRKTVEIMPMEKRR